MTHEEFKAQHLTEQIGKMAQDHATASAELHLQYTLAIQKLQDEIQRLQAEIEQLKAVDDPNSAPEVEGPTPGE